MNCLKRGALIVVEGVDRSGKSTQCKKLVQSLNENNIQADLISFPDRTTIIGGIIDSYLKARSELCDEAIHLMFTANRWEKRNKMEKLLKSGTTLVVDRYSYSGIVYSSIKKSMGVQWCQEPENGLLKPDLVFLLTLSENEIAKRPNYGDERYETKIIQEKVAEAFLQMSRENQDWKIVKADGNIEDVHKILLEEALQKISEVGTQPLGSLNFAPFHKNGLCTDKNIIFTK